MPDDSSLKAVEVVELTKVFKDFWGRPRVRAVDGLSFDIRAGEVFGLLGPNGSGKTTTIRMLLGLLFPTKGVVRILGAPPRSVSAKKRIGYMPEESHFYPYLNAEEILDFYCRLFHLSKSERQHRISHLLGMVGLSGARHRPIREYSKGMARRIGIAQALVNDPDMILLDEPTTGLDPIGTREVKDLIRQLKNRGKTVLLCSHLLADVEDVCDRIAILYGGKLRAQGAVSVLLAQKEQTQIVTDKLPKPVIEKVLELIRNESGHQRIEVGEPTQRLEAFFLDVVERARTEMVPTSGAEVSRMDIQFFDRREGAMGDALVEHLVEAAKVVPQPVKPEAVSAPNAPESDEAMLKEMSEAALKAPVARKPAEPKPLMPVRQDVLNELLQNPRQEPRKEDDAAKKDTKDD
ncbi:MAG TPA: ABC transporter ATP-binding protein [Candidatus Brocadiia bacterium]|nr:ABC transporter ATP-binding protein [Candidatus Brocadiia bacterium]